MSHPSARLVYGLRLSDGPGSWTFAEFEPGTPENDYVERFAMPWFVEDFGDAGNMDAVMESPADLLCDRLSREGVDDVTIVTSDSYGDPTGDYLLAVNPRVGGSEEGVYDVGLSALAARPEAEAWDARLARAREALGVTFAEPVTPSWFLVVSVG